VLNIGKLRITINNIRFYDYKHLFKEIIFYFSVIFLIIFIILIFSGNIKIVILQSDDLLDSYGWLVVNMIAYGGFFTSCQFFIFGTTKKGVKYSIIIIFLAIFILGLGTLSLQFNLYLPLILYPYFCMSNANGLYFLSLNFYLFLVFFGLSIPLMREKTGV